MSRIIINGRFLTRSMTGVDRYAIEITKSIDQLLGEGNPIVRKHQWELVTPEGAKKLPLKYINQKTISKFQGQIWEQVALPAHSFGKTLLNLCNSAPLLKHQQLVVIHDIATVRVPDSYSKGFRLWYKLMIPVVLKCSKHVGTVSQFSRDELASTYGSRPDITVLPEGAEHLSLIPPDTSTIEKHGLGTRPYVLAVGSMAPHKNFKVLIEAASLLKDPPFDIVIAGGTNPKIFANQQQELPNWVKHVGYVSDNQLKSLFEHAGCFVFPSLYEGYGLPPTEAMSLGCPVLCARSASLPEVCGDAAMYFDPHSAKQLADTLVRFFSESGIGDNLKSLGQKNVIDRTWRNAALAVVKSLERA